MQLEARIEQKYTKGRVLLGRNPIYRQICFNLNRKQYETWTKDYIMAELFIGIALKEPLVKKNSSFLGKTEFRKL